MPNNHEHASSALMYPEKHASPGLFINTIPYLPIWYLANLNILACYFSFFNSFVQLHLPKCARMTGPKVNHLFVMASIACECSQTPSKDKTQPKCCCAFYHEPTSSKSAVIVVISKSSLCHAVAWIKNAIFEGCLFTSRSKTV